SCPGDGPLVEELLRRGIPRKEAMFVPWRKLWGYLQRAAAIRGLRQVIEMEQPSLLHVNDIWWVPQTLRARAGSGGSLIPLVAHVRQGIESRKVRLYELDQADLVMAVSHRVEQSLREGGVRPERIETVHSALDQYAHPDRMEGFGIAVLEAMAMRKPVIATRTGGIPEIVQEGKTGILVSPGEPDKLAQAIVDLLQDSTRRVAMGRSARNRVETMFTVEAMMDKLTAAYGLLLGKETSLTSSVSV